MASSSAVRKPAGTGSARDCWSTRSTHGASGRRYFDSRLGKNVVRILPGDYLVTGEDVGLVTTLGSCVSACIRDPAAGVGGINHFMLPESEMSGPSVASARYGGYAMELLINQLLKQGAHRDNLEAKVFGGGAVLPGITISDVGGRNAKFVHDYLGNEHIPILAEDLGGIHPRKIVYFPLSGRVLVMRLAAALNREEMDAERKYQESLRSRPVTGDVELFD
jgi:chemotaxis protein CheD